MPDTIRIINLETRCIIGTLPHERTTPQRLVIDLELTCDLTAAGASDNLADTIDYAALANGALEVARQSRCHLLERLGTLLADYCLARSGVMAVAVQLQKPEALADGAIASVTMRRARCEA